MNDRECCFLSPWHSKGRQGEFPGGPVVKIPVFHCQGGPGLIPGRGTKILQAVRRGQKKKKKWQAVSKKAILGLFSGGSQSHSLSGKSGLTPVRHLTLIPPAFGHFAGIESSQQDAHQAR